MKLTVLLLTVAFLQVNANGFSQTITYSGKDVPLKKVFAVIKEQAGFSFLFFDEQLKEAKKVSIAVKNAPVEEVLSICMKDQPYDYTIKAKTIFIINKSKQEIYSSVGTTNVQKGKRINISGKVIGEQGEPVIGATVTIKGTDVATATNERGEFFLNEVDEYAVLVVTNVSYQRQEISLKGNTIINVRLKVSTNDLDETVVVAYNTTTVRKNTGSVTVLKGDQVSNLPNRSIDKSLQGLVPGLLVTSGSGQPGGGVSDFVLRGIATATSTLSGASSVRSPLIILDGVPISQENFQMNFSNAYGAPITNPLAQFNMSDIESISVLKDAAAIALYGARSSNGVIVITTKKGKSGKTRFNFSHQTDVSTILKGKMNLLNEDEYLELLNETYKNSTRTIGGVAVPYSDADILTDLRKKFPYIVNSPGDTSFYPGTNWFDKIYNNHATTIVNDLSISGGADKTNFYLNLEYTKQNGALINTGYDRKSVRFNFENRPNSWLKLGLNSTFSYNVQKYGRSVRGSDGSSISYLSPLNPVRSVDGNYIFNYTTGGTSSGTIANSVAASELNINRTKAYRGLSKIYGEVSFLKHLKFTSSLGVDYMMTETKEKADPRLYDLGNPVTVNTSTAGRIEEQDIRRANLITTNVLSFDNVWNNEHNVNVIVGQEAQVLTQRSMLTAVRGLSVPYYEELNSPGVSLLRYDGYSTKETLLSYFGQANYGFRNKYLLTASLRRDGSSRFGIEKRFGTYWSTGVGWVITSESFMKSISPWVSYLKVRGSIGAAGNAGGINANTRYDQLTNTTFLNGLAIYSSVPGNPDIQWEQTFTWDAGVEAHFLKDRVTFTLDLYKRKTSDLIYLTPIAGNSGFGAVLSNIGDIKNEGTEMSISTDIIKNKSFKWNLQANWSSNKNVLVKANGPEVAAFNYLANKEGENFNSFYLVKWAGVDPADGSALYLDDQGKETKTNSPNNRIFAGKPQPDGFGAITSTLTYKNFELKAMFYYQYGYQIYVNDYLVNDGFYPYMLQDKRALDRWQKQGDMANNPKRILNNSAGNQPSTRFLYDGDHIALKNASLAYNFSKALTDRLHIGLLRVFIQGSNLAFWTKYPGQDLTSVNPSGYIDNSYPNTRTFSAGLNVSF